MSLGTLLLLRSVTAAMGTLCLLCAHYFGKWEWLVICLPFLVSIVVHLGATLVTLRWYAWAKAHISGERVKENLGSILGQVGVFIKKKDYLWCIGIGGCLSFVWIYSINMAPLTVDSLLRDFSSGELNWNDILSATLISFAIPFANLLGVKTFFNYLFKGMTRQHLFRKLDSWLGIGAILSWLVIALLLVSYGPWGNETVFVVSVLAFLLAPFNIWTGWMRIPLSEDALKNPEYSKEFGESHVFYYSLIEGFKETCFGVLAVLYAAAENVISFPLFGIVLGVAGFGSLVSWRLFRIGQTQAIPNLVATGDK